MLRPKALLKEIGRVYPQIWQQVKTFRASKGKDLPDWPDWCYLPIAAGYAIVSQGMNISAPHLLNVPFSPAVVTAAATWRVSQGVYRYDADLYNSLVVQPMDGNVPCEALKRLPEWCVYIETLPGLTFCGKPIEGLWAHLESDANDGRMELRFVFFASNGNLPQLSIHLGDWTIEEGLARMQAISEKEAEKIGVNLNFPNLYSVMVPEIVPYLQLVLYLCAENADIPVIRHPNTRVRMSGQVDVPKEPRFWVVGERVGSAIRKYRNSRGDLSDNVGVPNSHASPRPHIRRAHWHHFWIGQLNSERKLILRWLPPIPVRMDYDSEGPVVIHKVK